MIKFNIYKYSFVAIIFCVIGYYIGSNITKDLLKVAHINKQLSFQKSHNFDIELVNKILQKSRHTNIREIKFSQNSFRFQSYGEDGRYNKLFLTGSLNNKNINYYCEFGVNDNMHILYLNNESITFGKTTDTLLLKQQLAKEIVKD